MRFSDDRMCANAEKGILDKYILPLSARYISSYIALQNDLVNRSTHARTSENDQLKVDRYGGDTDRQNIWDRRIRACKSDTSKYLLVFLLLNHTCIC